MVFNATFSNISVISECIMILVKVIQVFIDNREYVISDVTKQCINS
jgi:hypothetical protein